VLITTNLLKNLGKTYIYFRDWNIKYTKHDKSGGLIEVESPEGAMYCNYSFEIEVINNSETPSGLREIKVKFYSDNQLLVDSIPNDEATKKVWTGGTIFAPLKIINLPSKQMVYYKVNGLIKEEKLESFNNYKRVYFEALNRNGKKIKRLIHKKPKTPKYRLP